jgi:hypothetical protein
LKYNIFVKNETGWVLPDPRQIEESYRKNAFLAFKTKTPSVLFLQVKASYALYCEHFYKINSLEQDWLRCGETEPATGKAAEKWQTAASRQNPRTAAAARG